MQDLISFLEPVVLTDISEDTTYTPLQLGANIQFDSWDEADLVLVGCGEWRGAHAGASYSNSALQVRKELYKMYYWHNGVKIADAGDVKQGATLDDTRAALLMVLNEINNSKKIAIIIGGSHDLTMQQYEVYKTLQQNLIASIADIYIDLDEAEGMNANSFLLDMLTETPNFILHYNHIAFQSYYAHPKMLETLDKLRFDFYRLGKVRENIEEMEPVLRSSTIFSIDMPVVRYCDAPSNKDGSPNGLTGEEICQLTRYAGMSDTLTSLGIFGYNEKDDRNHMTARLIAQMIWYFIDGCLVRKTEAKLTEHDEFIMLSVVFTEIETVFLKSKRTNRWWMRLPNSSYVPCSYNDYLTACRNDIPERWLREQERLS